MKSVFKYICAENYTTKSKDFQTQCSKVASRPHPVLF